MNDVTQLLADINAGKAEAQEALMAIVYSELRQIAARQMSREDPNHTLQPTALVHEAWIRLAGKQPIQFDGRAHFFTAAADSMRRILIESARRKSRHKRGSDPEREVIDLNSIAVESCPDELLAIDEALEELEREDRTAASLVKLRYFVGMNMEEAAAALNLPVRSAERLWTYAKAWLRRRIRPS